MRKRLVIPLTVAVLSCVGTVPPETFTDGTITLACCGHADEPVRLAFLGVGGWLIEKGEAAVLTAPLFSNPRLATVGLGQIETDPDRVERHLPDISHVSAILVGHGHYDHLMDVPYVARHRAPPAVVYGNRTVAHQLAPFELGPGRVRVIVESELGDVERPGAWIDVGPRVRIMPLRSSHAPHLAGILLYDGVRTLDMDRVPRAAAEWLAGETVAFLVDLMNHDGSVGLRVYYQDAVAAPPLGLVPQLADSLDVDVAIIVPATYAEVDWHPEALIESARPRLVLLSHWEDFFQAPSLPPDPVSFTRLPEFISRLDRAVSEGTQWHLPLPGARFVLQ